MIQQIAGAGGGKKKKKQAPQPQPIVQQTVVVHQPAPSAPSASDDKNTLFSKASVRVIDLVSEGEIEGFVESTNEKSVFLDGTPIKDAEGNNNFVFDEFTFKPGTQAQSYISGFPAAESVVSVNAAVGDAVNDSVVRTITDGDVDRVIVTIQVPQLFVVSNGLKQTKLKYTIDVQPNGGSYSTEVNGELDGKCTSTYERSHSIDLTGSAPWNIRLTRTEGVHDGSTNYRRLSLASYTEVIDGKLRYPLSAVVGLRFEATQFQQVPTRSYDVKGIKVQIPSNATVNSTTGALTYSGVWDGTFQTAWCADPAWIMRDLIISSRYGLGRFVSSAQVDKWSLYEISKYCAELVDDGLGGTEPRFTCNVYMQSRDEAYNVIQDFASVFRGMAYWSAGQIAFSQDRPSDPVALFSNANVIDGNFNYEGSSIKARHTVALVTWNDPEDAYEQKVEYVSDEDAIAKYGLIETRIAAFGCTSRGQAFRAGKWLLYQEQNETQTCTFKVGLDGAIVRPGQIIKVMDRLRAGARKAGRVSAASGTTITLDQAITVAENDTLSVVLPDGTVEERTISEASTGAAVTISTAFSQTPAAQTIFVIETTDLVAATYRVISVTEEDQLYSIVGLEHNTGKYANVEDGTALQPRDVTLLNEDPAEPSGLSVDERLVERGTQVTTEITISWNSVRSATAYQVSFKTSDTAAYEVIRDTPYNSLSFTTNETGDFTFRVVAINPLGKRSKPSTLTQTIEGKLTVPADVQNLSFEAISANSGRLRWDETTDLDVKVGGRVYIRHSNKTDGSGTWSNSTDLIKAKAGSQTEAIVPLVEGEILVKFADDGGRLSTNATSVIVDLPDTVGSLLVLADRENADNPKFQGTHTNTFYNTDVDALVLSGTDLLDDVTDFDDLASLDFSGDIAESGNYVFLDSLDLIRTYSIDLKRYFVTSGYFPSDLLDNRSGNVDDYTDWDGTVADEVNARLELRTTSDEPGAQDPIDSRLPLVDDYADWDGAAPTFGDWQEFVNGTFKARGFQFRTVLTSEDVAQSILVDELGYNASFQRRTEQPNAAIASGAGTKSITFDNGFFTGTASLGGSDAYLPSVGITAQNMASGDYFELSNVTYAGFDVTFKNSSNAAVDRNFTYTAVGYGKAG